MTQPQILTTEDNISEDMFVSVRVQTLRYFIVAALQLCGIVQCNHAGNKDELWLRTTSAHRQGCVAFLRCCG